MKFKTEKNKKKTTKSKYKNTQTKKKKTYVRRQSKLFIKTITNEKDKYI